MRKSNMVKKELCFLPIYQIKLLNIHGHSLHQHKTCSFHNIDKQLTDLLGRPIADWLRRLHEKNIFPKVALARKLYSWKQI